MRGIGEKVAVNGCNMVLLFGRMMYEQLSSAAVEGAGESDARGGEALINRGLVQLVGAFVHELLDGARHGGAAAGALVGGGEDAAAAGLGFELDGEEGPEEAREGLEREEVGGEAMRRRWLGEKASRSRP